MKVCLDCLLIEENQEKYCSNCNSLNVAIFEKNKVLYNNRVYTKKEWFIKLCSYQKIDKNGIILKNQTKNINISYLKEIFLENCQKYTKLAYNLPCVVFFFVSLISILSGVLIEKNGINNIEGFSGDVNNIIIFMYFLAFIYFLFSFLLFYFYKIKKNKAYICKAYGQTKIEHISNKRYKEIIEIFNQIGESK